MQRNNWTILALKLAFACLATVAITAFLVGTEARITNGLALTNAEYMIAVEAPDVAPSRHVVEAR